MELSQLESKMSVNTQNLDGTYPALEHAIKCGMPFNRKRSCFVHERDTKQISSYWSGGSIDKWSMVHLEGAKGDRTTSIVRMLKGTLPPHAGAPQFGGNGVEVELKDGDILIGGGIMSGKPRMPTIYANEWTLSVLFETYVRHPKYPVSPMTKEACARLGR